MKEEEEDEYSKIERNVRGRLLAYVATVACEISMLLVLPAHHMCHSQDPTVSSGLISDSSCQLHWEHLIPMMGKGGAKITLQNPAVPFRTINQEL